MFRKVSPDLILTVTGYQDSVSDQLRNYFPTFSFRQPAFLGGVFDLVIKTGLVTGKVEETRLLETELLEIAGTIKEGPRRSVYIEIDLRGPVTFGFFSISAIP